MTEPQILTVGHSNHPIERLFDLLGSHGATAIVDVRTAPYSRFSPQFNKQALAASAASRGLAYVFLGVELGGRPSDDLLDDDGVADYIGMAATPAFATGISRVEQGIAKGYRIALLCSERDCLDCHRNLLVGRALEAKGISIGHIAADGRLEPQGAMIERLLAWAGRPPGLFEAPSVALDDAYLKRAKKVAWRKAAA